MRRTVATALLALLVALPAAARAQMPDPRQMSGTPRPDETVEAGKIVVRVVHGSLAALAAPGTKVTLVRVGADGSVAKTAADVDATGHATFADLPHEGRNVYYVFCALDGDRLLSQPISLPPRIGVKVMLAGRALDAAKKPVGEPVDDEDKTAEHGAPKVAAGKVEVLAVGEIPKGAKLALREVGGAIAAEKPGAGEDGRVEATFEGVAADPDKVWVVEVVDPAGKMHHSRPFLMLGERGVSLQMVALDRPLFVLQGGLQIDDDVAVVDLQLGLMNYDAAPLDLDKPLVTPLPVGFGNASLNDDPPSRARLEPGVGLVWSGAVPPGGTEATVRFTLPIHGGQASFELPLPMGLYNGGVFIERAEGAAVTPRAAVGAPQQVRGEDGREYWVYRDLHIEPGAKLAFDVVGLPMRSRVDFWGRLAVGLFVLGLVVAAALVAAIPRGRAADHKAPAADPAERRRELERRRDRLYEKLVALERSRVAYRVDEQAYDRERKALVAQLVVVHRELDHLAQVSGKGGPGKKSARTG